MDGQNFATCPNLLAVEDRAVLYSHTSSDPEGVVRGTRYLLRTQLESGQL